MFFLGLLSTPLPYLLLAAFYFFGFAMGMFNNNTGDEVLDTTISSVTIPAEIKQKNTDHSVYYFQITNSERKTQNNTLKYSDSSVEFSPDTGIKVFLDRNAVFYEFRLSKFQFSRPPPPVC